MEKLSPILAYYVVDNLEEGCNRATEVLRYGGMGHTASIHTGSRDAARDYGLRMPVSRVIVNSPSTHGAIGFTTDLEPSMTLGCGSWGGNVTSDNISPRHLLDVKRIAFETKAITGLLLQRKPQFQAQLLTTSTWTVRLSRNWLIVFCRSARSILHNQRLSLFNHLLRRNQSLSSCSPHQLFNLRL